MSRLALLLFVAVLSRRLSPNNISSVDALSLGAPQLRLPNIFGAKSFSSTSRSTKTTFVYTHLECNGQLWQIKNNNNSNAPVSIVVDPLASQLDFGIPWGYRANKKSLSEKATIDLICDAKPTHCLLTMGLDDHTHLPTLTKLNERMPELTYVVAPSCASKLMKFGLIDSDRIVVLNHGESCILLNEVGGAREAKVTATRGALVGPPWQNRENGYLLELRNQAGGEIKEDDDREISIYYEPHGDVVLSDIKRLRADVVVTPITKQSLPAQVPPAGRFTLVHGGESALEIAETLGARTIVPLGNGALDVEGPLAKLVEASGDVDDFENMVELSNVARGGNGDDGIRVAVPTPGVPLTVTV